MLKTAACSQLFPRSCEPTSKIENALSYLNPLGTVNRELRGEQGIDFTLGDGTPTTPNAVDAHVSAYAFPSMDGETMRQFSTITYGPAAGFPDAIARFKTEHPEFQDKHFLFNAGDQTANLLTEKACKSLGNSTTIITLTQDEYQQRSTTPSVQQKLKIWAQNPAAILRIQLSQPAQDPLAVDIHNDTQIFEQTLRNQGYVGPVLAPVAQRLYAAKIDQSTDPTPPFSAQKWTAYFAEQVGLQHLGTSFSSSLCDGGCSGALFHILKRSPLATTLLQEPFFVPQQGIVQAVQDNLVITQDLVTTMEKTEPCNVLLTFPNNPDGRIPEETEIRKIVEIANQKGHQLILDATYYNMVQPEYQARYIAAMAELSKADNLVLIASGSKSLGLTKYRAALILTNGGSHAQKSTANLPDLTPSAHLALSATFDPEVLNKTTLASQISKNVTTNTSIIRDILARTYVPTQPLNTGLEKLQQIVENLHARFPNEKLEIEEGQGALYARLVVPPALQAPLRQSLTERSLALIPGEMFSGVSNTPIAEILTNPQAWYRLSLMSSPYKE